MITSKYAKQLGGATGLGSLPTKDEPKIYRKIPCKKAHRWVAAKYSRHCTRCGLHEEKSPSGAWVPALANVGSQPRGQNADKHTL